MTSKSLLTLTLVVIILSSTIIVSQTIRSNAFRTRTKAQVVCNFSIYNDLDLANANNLIKPGQTACVYPGSYRNQIAPATSGTGNANRITYLGINSPTLRSFINLANRSYITISGINLVADDSSLRYADLLNGSYLTIENCKMEPDPATKAPYHPPLRFNNTSWSILRNCKIVGSNKVYNDLIGLWNNSHHNLIEGNTILQGSHASVILENDGTTINAPRFNVFRNNRIVNDYHVCIAFEYGPHSNLFEGNYLERCGSGTYAYSGDLFYDPHGAVGDLHFWGDGTIFRYNVINKSGNSDPSSEGTRAVHAVSSNYTASQNSYEGQVTVTKNRIYNNVIADNFNGSFDLGIYHRRLYDRDKYADNHFVNNILFNTQAKDGIEVHYAHYADTDDGAPIPADVSGDKWRNNLIGGSCGQKVIGWKSGKYSIAEAELLSNPEFKGNICGNPSFVNPQLCDYNVNPGSPSVNGGDYLTFVSVSGSGSTIEVVDARFFTDGFGVVQGDRVRIGDDGASGDLRIVSVGYDTNTITLNRPISYSAGEGVSLLFNGTRPDIGIGESGLMGLSLGSGCVASGTFSPSPQHTPIPVSTPSPTPTQTPGSSRTLTLQVSAPEDDANSCNWPVTGNSSVRVGSTSCSYTGGFRFLNTGLPQGATIQSAYLELNSLYKSPGGLTLILNADSASYSPSRNSASFVDRDTSTSARPRTTASVSWTPTAFTSGSWQRSPDIRSVVQEMVNHSAWQSANSLTLMVNPTTVDGSYWNVGTADDGASDAARLVVTYAPASASTPTPVLPTPTPIPTSTPRPTSIPTSAPSPTLSPTTPPQLTPTPTPPPVSSCQYDVSNTIPGRIQAENFTCGGQGVAYYDTDSSNNGNSYRVSEAVDIQPTGDVGGGHNVGWIRNGEWLDYRVQVSQTGTYSVTFRTASNTFSGSRLFRLLVNGQDVTGQLTAPKTGGWQSYVNVTASNIHLTSGSHRLRLQIDGGGFNLNYMDFQLTSAPVSRTLTLQVSAPEDDANSCNWPVTGNSSVRVGSTSCSYTGGFRFLNTGLPQGATIQSAYLELNSLYKSPGGLTLILNADSASYSPSRNSASFVNRDTSTSARPRTTASVSWTPTAFTSGSWQRSPDIRSVVQEMVNHSAWQSANSLTLMVNPTTVDGSYWNVGTADDGASDAARLVVTYTHTH